MTFQRLIAGGLLVVLSAGCGDDDSGVDPNGDSGVDPNGDSGEPIPRTYYADIVPLVQRECLTCHVEGGIGPFRLDSYEAVVDQAPAVVGAVTSGYMPPWMPSRDCGEIVGERGLSDEERQVFVDWNAGGLAMGDPADAPPPPEERDLTLTPTDAATIGGGGYVPDVDRPDDYRCFLLDMPIEETSYLTASQVVPDRKEMVHHVLVYAVPPGSVADAEAADAADATEGYTCFGGPLPDSEGGVPPTQLGAWVPGSFPDVMPEGRGIRIEAGSRIVMQVHYNTLEAEAVADQTEFQAVLQVEPPAILVETLPLPILRLDIPAGERNVVESGVFRNWTDEPMTITSLSPHMHLLGTVFSARFMPAAGSPDESQCLLEIPRWDFQWQQGYRRPVDSPVVLQPGEGIEVSCTYDNSATNQPIVNGAQVEPRDVTWGEGTLDEMCILYIRREAAFEAPPVTVLDGCTAESVDACRAECGDGLACLYACDALTANRECQNCATSQTVECVRATSECGLEWLTLGDCLYQCTINVNLLDGDLDLCLQSECGGMYDAMLACTDAMLAAGTCDSYLSTCGEGLVAAP